MLRDISADERVEPACRHAQFAENFAAEITAGFIGCVGHQDVVALFNECQNGVGDRRRTAREERASGAAFQFTHGFWAKSESAFPGVRKIIRRWRDCG